MAEKKQGAIAFIFVTLLIDIIGLGIIIPVMPELISSMIKSSFSEAAKYAGWLMFAYSIMQFLFAPVLGNLSDRYGRRPVILVSLFGLGIDYIFLALAPTVGWLFVGRVIAGICGASFTTAQAYIADISPPEKRAQNFGMIGVAFGLGFIIGPVIGGLLGQLGPRVPFVAAACLSLINVCYGYFILPESLSKEKRRKFEIRRANPIGSLRALRRYPIISGLVISLVCISIAAHSVQSTWAFFTMTVMHWSEAQVGYSLGFVGFMIALVQGGLIRILIPKIGQKRSVYFGLAVYGIGLLLFAFATKGWMMYAFLVPYCLGAICGPAMQAIMSSQIPSNQQGEFQGALTSLVSVTSIVGPPIMTNLFSFFTSDKAPFYFPGAAFMTGAFLTLVSLLFAMRTLTGYIHSHEYVAPNPEAEKNPEA